MKSKLKVVAYAVSAVVAVGLVTTIGVILYNHRVVESKCFPATATITAHEYIPPHTTYTTYHNKSGLHRVPHYHPARYYLYYTVSFEGCAYNGNKEDVGAEYFNLHKDGDEVNAVFKRQWRADGSETYEIYLER
jgi:hypothetical protein